MTFVPDLPSPAESADGEEARWILITNTHHAGTKWLGTLLAADRNVAYRHNRVSLLAGGSVFARVATSLTILPGLEDIDTDPQRYSIADHFRHLETNFPCRICAQSDAGHILYFLANLVAFPAQIAQLRERDFRVRNIVMDPVRVLDAMHRMLMMFRRKGMAIPPLTFPQPLYDALCPRGLPRHSDEDLFLSALLHLANEFARDAALAHEFELTTMSFEAIFMDRARLLSEVSDLSAGRIVIPEEKLSEFYQARSAHSLRNHEALANAEGAARDIFGEGRLYYQGLNAWGREMIAMVYSSYDIFSHYRTLGYDFSYVEFPSVSPLSGFAPDAIRYGWPAFPLDTETRQFLRDASARRA